jgi:hypothetical protein
MNVIDKAADKIEVSALFLCILSYVLKYNRSNISVSIGSRFLVDHTKVDPNFNKWHRWKNLAKAFCCFC